MKDNNDINPKSDGDTPTAIPADEATPDANAGAKDDGQKRSGSKAAPNHGKSKLSGAYYYLEADEQTLSKYSLIRTVLFIIALLVQIIMLLFVPQGGLEYVTYNLPSYSYVFAFAVFVMLGINIYAIIMNIVRYKITKRLPKEYAPKSGFKRFVFFSSELLLAAYLLILAMEISFVCISYDIFGLIAVFLCAAATGAIVFARQYTLRIMRDAVLIEAPNAEQPATDNEKSSEPNNGDK